MLREIKGRAYYNSIMIENQRPRCLIFAYFAHLPLLCRCCWILIWRRTNKQINSLLVSVMNLYELQSINVFFLITFKLGHSRQFMNRINSVPKIPIRFGHNWIMVLFTKALWIANLILHFYEIFLSLLDAIQENFPNIFQLIEIISLIVSEIKFPFLKGEDKKI